MRKIIIANWKLNPKTKTEALRLARAVDAKGVVVCPPDPFISPVAGVIKKATLGAQDAFFEHSGAFTGESSPTQLKSLGVKYVILGHSERRRLAGEGDTAINKKTLAALEAGLIPVICVGEGFTTHRIGKTATKSFVLSQIRAVLKGVSQEKAFIVAYEPVWSISTSGTGLKDTPEEAEIIIQAIRKYLDKKGFMKARVIYGGSVNKGSAKKYLAKEVIEGVLVGAASLNADDFKKITSNNL